MGTIQGTARKLGVHRRLVREALVNPIPREEASPERAQPQVGPLAAFIDTILEADRKAPRKQRHTAHRIFARIQKEHLESTIAESTVRRSAHGRKVALGLAGEARVLQSCPWGSEA